MPEPSLAHPAETVSYLAANGVSKVVQSLQLMSLSGTAEVDSVISPAKLGARVMLQGTLSTDNLAALSDPLNCCDLPSMIWNVNWKYDVSEEIH